MSVTTNIYVVLGIKLSEKVLHIGVIEPGCPHKLPAGNKFCPECGKPSEVVKNEYHPEIDWDNETFFGFNMLQGDEYSGSVYLGNIIAKLGAYDDFNDICFSVSESRRALFLKKLRSKLLPEKLWDSKAYGFWIGKVVS